MIGKMGPSGHLRPIPFLPDRLLEREIRFPRHSESSSYWHGRVQPLIVCWSRVLHLKPAEIQQQYPLPRRQLSPTFARLVPPWVVWRLKAKFLPCH